LKKWGSELIIQCSITSKCKSCGVKIIWGKTAKGHNIPLNEETISIVPSETGKVTVVTLDGKVVKGNLAMKGRAMPVYRKSR